jgi:hypothetical protein
VAGSGAAGAAGTGGGAACAGDPLTRCTGTMSGPWCVETVPGTGVGPFFGDLWANRPDDVWWVGGQFQDDGPGTATLAHFDGCTWTVTPRPDLPLLATVWGAAPNDVWMGGNGGNAYHWNGTTLTAFPVPGSGSIVSISGTSSTDVWAAGTVISHWNGSAWTSSMPGLTEDIWAVAPNDVWAASGGNALHYDGVTWTGTRVSDFGLRSIWGDGTQAYAAGGGDGIFRFAGGAWTTLQAPVLGVNGFVEIGGLGADIFAVGTGQVVRLSGATFMTVPDLSSPISFETVWVSPTQIWLGSDDGYVARRPR